MTVVKKTKQNKKNLWQGENCLHSFRQRSRQHIAKKTSGYALLRKGLRGSKKLDQYKHATFAILDIKNPHLFERLSIFSKLSF